MPRHRVERSLDEIIDVANRVSSLGRLWRRHDKFDCHFQIPGERLQIYRSENFTHVFAKFLVPLAVVGSPAGHPWTTCWNRLDRKENSLLELVVIFDRVVGAIPAINAVEVIRSGIREITFFH